MPVRPGRRRLGRAFYNRPTLQVARDLLGRRLVRVSQGRRLSGRIVEVEAYIGTADTACHARSGETRRNRVMFGGPGQAYVYFTYGMHHLLNLVTEPEGVPAAVLLRALEPEEGLPAMVRRRGGAAARRSAPGRRAAHWIAGGPARLCQALGIDLAFNDADVTRGHDLFVETGEPLCDTCVATGPRVGIDYANSRDQRALWRLFVRDSAYVSRQDSKPGGSRRRLATPRAGVD